MNKYIILGPPGSGKSTQAQMLAKVHGFVRISVGDIFRWNVKNHTKLGARIYEYIDSGQLVPDATVEEVVKVRLEQHDWSFGFVLDGYPASRTQAGLFLQSYDVDGVVQLQVPDALLTERLSCLRVCGACGFDYNLIYARSLPETVCDFCGGELVNRSSERPESIRERLREYHNKTVPVLELFRQRELLVEVDGTKPLEDIHAHICAELGLSTEAARQRLRSQNPAGAARVIPAEGL